MANSTRRDGDVSKLHPAIREKVHTIRDQLRKEKIPFEIFEAFRTPERQAVLNAKRPRVTWAGPWRSIHQYGLAVDFVLKIDGKWTWDDSGAEARHWHRMHELAKTHGMTPLFSKTGKLMEKPHVQLAGVSVLEMRKGLYPEGGDEVWAEQLGELIDNWEGPGPAPPKPALAPERPPLNAAIIAELNAEREDDDKTFSANTQDPRFQHLHSFIKRWEGGFVDHPADKGGATNMGITIGTLAEWRGATVTVDDVRNLTRTEADEILRTKYFSACRCGEMPERMAMVVYNCAVLSGRKTATKFAQEAFNSLGLTVDGDRLEVDGILGRLTIGAIKKTDSSILAEAFLDRHEAYLRSLETFDVFGTGWMNRLAALREFVNTLPQGAGIRPTKTMTVTDANTDLEAIIGSLGTVREGNPKAILSRVAIELLEADRDDSKSATRKKAILRLLLNKLLQEKDTPDNATTVTKGSDGKPPLTPINAALGQTIGRVLNGKKSVSGIFGLLLTSTLPNLGISGDIINFINQNSNMLITIFALLAGWGMFGKIDKAVRLMGMVHTNR